MKLIYKMAFGVVNNLRELILFSVNDCEHYALSHARRWYTKIN